MQKQRDILAKGKEGLAKELEELRQQQQPHTVSKVAERKRELMAENDNLRCRLAEEKTRREERAELIRKYENTLNEVCITLL